MHPGWPFSAIHGRMPPIKLLALQQEESSIPHHEWPYTSEQVVEIWDFSQLHHLRLSFEAPSFIETVPPKSLVSLRGLYIDLEDPTQEADMETAEDISKFIQDIPHLEILDIRGHSRTYIVNSLKRQKTLRRLSLSQGCDIETWNGLEELRKIQSSCPLLESLLLCLHFLREETANEVSPDDIVLKQCNYSCNLVRIFCSTYAKRSPHLGTSEGYIFCA